MCALTFQTSLCFDTRERAEVPQWDVKHVNLADITSVAGQRATNDAFLARPQARRRLCNPLDIILIRLHEADTIYNHCKTVDLLAEAK